jgi:ribulose kinase
MFLLILVCLVYVCAYKRHTKINRNIQKTHQNQQKHTKDTPKSTQTYKRTTKINKNIQKNHQNQQKHTKDPPKSMCLVYVSVDFGGSFACLC